MQARTSCLPGRSSSRGPPRPAGSTSQTWPPSAVPTPGSCVAETASTFALHPVHVQGLGPCSSWRQHRGASCHATGTIHAQCAHGLVSPVGGTASKRAVGALVSFFFYQCLLRLLELTPWDLQGSKPPAAKPARRALAARRRACLDDAPEVLGGHGEDAILLGRHCSLACWAPAPATCRWVDQAPGGARVGDGAPR